MLRVYCDSNIYRYLNPLHPSHNSDLLSFFKCLKDKMLFTFSDAHLDDLKDSVMEYAEKDLLLMGEYVKDNYFMHDFISKKRTSPYLATPLEAFKNKNYEAYRNVLENPFDLDSLFKEFDDIPMGPMIKNLVKKIYDAPISIFGTANKELTPRDQELMRKFSPNYHDTMTLNELMNDMWPYSKSLLFDKNEFTQLRRYIASYINRDDFSFEEWGMMFNDKFKESPLKKTFLETVDDMLTEAQKENFYDRFNKAYTMLELYNVTREKKGKSLKKFSMESLNTDAAHAWYASFSDYLVTDDKGLQIKATIIYQLFNIPTKVLSSKDFLNHKSILLGSEETLQSLMASLRYDLKHGFQLYDRFDPFTNETVRTYKASHPYFNYFNCYQVISSKENLVIAFYCDRNSHASFFMFREIELLVSKLNSMLGRDNDSRGNYTMDEAGKYNDGEHVRLWFIDKIKFRLTQAFMKWGGTLCLSIELL